MNSNITPIVLIVASVGLFWLYTGPAYSATTGSADTAGKSIQELQSERQDYADALEKTREIELARTGLLAKFNAISDGDKAKLAAMLPNHIDSVRLIIDINTLAQKYGMSLSHLLLTADGGLSQSGTASAPAPAMGQPGPGTAAVAGFGGSSTSSAYNSITLGFSVTGSYDNFLLFLKELQESLRIVDVVSLSFSTTGGGGTGTGLSQTPQNKTSDPSQAPYAYTMTIRTYYLK